MNEQLLKRRLRQEMRRYVFELGVLDDLRKLERLDISEIMRRKDEAEKQTLDKIFAHIQKEF